MYSDDSVLEGVTSEKGRLLWRKWKGRRSGEETRNHIVLRCRKVRKVKDERGWGRREWARENEMSSLVTR